jgi:hypothetical protein
MTAHDRIAILKAILAATPGNTSAAQRARLLAAMQQTGHITTFEAMRFLDVYDPRPRKLELLAEGHRIMLSWRHVPTESGRPHRVGVYYIGRSGEVKP